MSIGVNNETNARTRVESVALDKVRGNQPELPSRIQLDGAKHVLELPASLLRASNNLERDIIPLALLRIPHTGARNLCAAERCPPSQ
jgi:hypothetical protein